MKSRIRRRTTKQAAALVDKNPTAAKAKRPDWGDTSKFFPDSGFEYSAPEFHNEFHVDPELIKQLEADGLVLQWTAHEIYGAPLTRQMGQAQQAGWVPVARGDLGGKLDYLAPEVGLGEVQAAQARVREVGRCARMRRPPRVPGIHALLQHREMRFVGHRLVRCGQSGWQPTVCQAQRGGELGANQALRIPQICSREVGAVEPCQAKVGTPKVNLSQ